MNNLSIRPAKLEELSLVIALTEEAYAVPYKKEARGSRPHEDEKTEVAFRDGELFILVAEQEGEVCGAVRYRFDDEDIYLFKLAVPEKFRRQGIGQSLVETVVGEAREKGSKKITLDCMEEKGLPAYYEKLEFKIDEIKEHHDHHDVYMSKNI